MDVINKKKIRSPKQVEAFNKMILKLADKNKAKKDAKDTTKKEKQSMKDKLKLQKKDIKKLSTLSSGGF